MDCLAGPLAVNLCVLAPQRQQNWYGILHFAECTGVVYLIGSLKRKKSMIWNVLQVRG
jgi:cobyrinic acid a,c-diamide synthase